MTLGMGSWDSAGLIRDAGTWEKADRLGKTDKLCKDTRLDKLQKGGNCADEYSIITSGHYGQSLKL